MSAVWTIARWCASDLLRSRWLLAYTLLFAGVTEALFALTEEPAQVIASLLNVLLLVVPLVASVFGLVQFHGSRDFFEVLLAQPVGRARVFAGEYLGAVGPLVLAPVAGLGAPFLWHGAAASGDAPAAAMLVAAAAALTLTFAGLALLVAVRTDDRVKGLAIVLTAWLALGLLYDALLLVLIVAGQAYPLEPALIALVFLNPLDLARVAILLQLDVAALMGYTGAVVERFLGSAWGTALALGALLAWVAAPAALALRAFTRRDF